MSERGTALDRIAHWIDTQDAEYLTPLSAENGTPMPQTAAPRTPRRADTGVRTQLLSYAGMARYRPACGAVVRAGQIARTEQRLHWRDTGQGGGPGPDAYSPWPPTLDYVTITWYFLGGGYACAWSAQPLLACQLGDYLVLQEGDTWVVMAEATFHAEYRAAGEEEP